MIGPGANGWCMLPNPASMGGVCSMVYMAIRTQIYLTEEHRVRLRDRAAREGRSMAELVREAVDAFLSGEDDLDATFGAAPEVAARVPSRDEWDRHR